MKKNKLWITKVLLALLFMCSAQILYAYDCEVNGIYYNLNKTDKTAAVTYKYLLNTNYEGSVNIPSEIQYSGVTYSVTSIGKEAFSFCKSLKEVVIGSGVTSIGEDAFWNCTGLTKITIPESVTSIGYSAFQDCSSLSEITIPNSITSIGQHVFEGCSNLKELTILNSSIGVSTYNNITSLTSLTIGRGVMSIANELENPFSGCINLEKIIVEEGNPIYHSRDNCNAIIISGTRGDELILGCKNTIIPNSISTIGDYAFQGCIGLSKITIPNSVSTIYGSSFAGCSGLEEIIVEEGNIFYDSRENCNAIITHRNELVVGCKNTIIPNSVTSIENDAFSGCTGLIKIDIPENVIIIKGWTFENCSNLKSVTIGNSVNEIRYSAFDGCDALTTVYSLNTTPPSLSSSTFTDNQYMTTNVFVPQDALAAYQSADGWKNFVNLQGFDATGIGSITVGKNGNNIYYDLHGNRLDAPKKGLNIINGKKVIMK